MSVFQQPLIENTTDIQIESEFIDHSNCCCNIAYFPVPKMLLCGDWICSPLNPIVITLSFIFITAVGYYDMIAYISNPIIRYVFIGVFSYLNLSVTFSYFYAIYIGPGYAPYNFFSLHSDWNNIDEKISELTFTEKCKTFVTYKEQMDFARQSKRPPRCCFSILSRRFVLRADHFCYWIRSWVGLKNTRYFILFTGYAFFHTIFWYVSHIWWFSSSFKPFHWMRYLTLLAGVLEIILLVLSCNYFIRGLINLCKNKTSLELLKGNVGINPYDKGCMNNCAEVCGEKRFCCLWWIPFFCFKPAANGIYDDLLSKNASSC